ncbi:MAG: chorismate synthase [Bdellovibrionales bacterium]|nr:chorismate synthase [Bdellovibrionales bacterium]
MNTFGRTFRVSVLGESHGTCVGALIDGCPAGLAIEQEDFAVDLARRQGGGRPGTTPRKEADIPIFKSGIYQGRTTGAPLLIVLENNNVRSNDYDAIKDKPRPGHADLVAKMKYGGFNDFRGGGHFSGRLTAAVVAAGVVAKKVLGEIKIKADIISVGGSCEIDRAVNKALEDGDSVGGIVECVVSDLPSGLGEPFFDSLESLLSHAAFSIPAVKAIEFGLGMKAACMRGSEFNDDILNADGKTRTNNSGGINGGLTNGNDLIYRIAIKPTSSIRKEKQTVDLTSGIPTSISVKGRHDACIALRVPPVLEATTALVLADLMMLENHLKRVFRN